MDISIEIYGNNIETKDMTQTVLINPDEISIGYLNNLIRPRKEGKKPLTFIQSLRAVKFYEVLVETSILRSANYPVQNYAIAHGSIVGTFLLMRLKDSLDASFYYHGFPADEWQFLVDSVSTTSSTVVHVFADEIDEACFKGEDYLELQTFIPGEHFEVPHYVREAIDLKVEMPLEERVKAMKAYIINKIVETFASILDEENRIVIVNANSLPSINFLKGYPVRYFDMKETHFSNKQSNNSPRMGVKLLG